MKQLIKLAVAIILLASCTPLGPCCVVENAQQGEDSYIRYSLDCDGAASNKIWYLKERYYLGDTICFTKH